MPSRTPPSRTAPGTWGNGAKDTHHPRGPRRAALARRSQEEGVPAPVDSCHHGRHHHARLRVRGRMAQRIHPTLEGLDVQPWLADLKKKVYRHPLIHAITDATITHVSGYVGNFVTQVKSKGRVREIHHGAAIIATGADEYKPSEYLY